MLLLLQTAAATSAADASPEACVPILAIIIDSKSTPAVTSGSDITYVFQVGAAY